MGQSEEKSDIETLVEIYLHDDPALVAKELAEPLGITRQGVHERLEHLINEGYVNTKKPGRDRIYWLTKPGQERAKKALRN